MTSRIKILVIGDDSAPRLPIYSAAEPASRAELSDSNPLEITLVGNGNNVFEYYELTNDRKCRPYLQLYLDMLKEVDVVIYICVCGQSVKDMKEWLRLLPLVPLKLLFVSDEAAYNSQTKLIQKLQECFHTEVVDSIVFLPRMGDTKLEDILMQISRKQRKTVTMDQYQRQSNPISFMKQLFAKRSEALSVPQSPV